ncbi:MAG TPA: GNAT family protein [Cellvibrionaceae bacterium]|nr:GNAT family protein [Cellvibrionaceae bacterium]HNG60060.1 GNAT family protein [Cellvibrionaceae bacterium]
MSARLRGSIAYGPRVVLLALSCQPEHTPMPYEINGFGQPLGERLPAWSPPPYPSGQVLKGRYCQLEPLQPHHTADLYRALGTSASDPGWTYLPYGPFASEAEFTQWLSGQCEQSDPFFYALLNPAGEALGLASYLRIAPQAGSIEVGHLHFGAAMARTPMATEAMYLLMQQAFAWGYRRYEWKCNALNGPSRRAAQRLGFSFEGVFRQAMVNKGRNRDTAWFAVIDRDWPALQAAFLTWLAEENFAADGSQRLRLSDLTSPLLVQRDTGFLGA